MKQRPRMAVMETSRELGRQDKQQCSSISCNKHITVPCSCHINSTAEHQGDGSDRRHREPPWRCAHPFCGQKHGPKHTCKVCWAPLVWNTAALAVLLLIPQAAAYSTSPGCVCVCNVCCREQRLEGFLNSSQFLWRFCERALSLVWLFPAFCPVLPGQVPDAVVCGAPKGESGKKTKSAKVKKQCEVKHPKNMKKSCRLFSVISQLGVWQRWHALAELGRQPCSSLQGKADVHPHTERGGDCSAAEPSPATPTCVKQCGWLSSQMQIRSEYKLEEINIGRELVSISFISSEIAAIVNSLT